MRVAIGGVIGITDNQGDATVKGGFKTGLGAGWEFFAGSDLALGVGIDGVYALMPGDDLVSVELVFELRHY